MYQSPPLSGSMQVPLKASGSYAAKLHSFRQLCSNLKSCVLFSGRWVFSHISLPSWFTTVFQLPTATVRVSEARQLMENEEGRSIIHLDHCKAVKINSGTAHFWSSIAPKSTHLLGYILRFVRLHRLMQFFHCSFPTTFPSSPSLTKKKWNPSHLHLVLPEKLIGEKWECGADKNIFWPRYSSHTSSPQGRCPARKILPWKLWNSNAMR